MPLARDWEPERLCSALNAVLPDDVAVRERRARRRRRSTRASTRCAAPTGTWWRRAASAARCCAATPGRSRGDLDVDAMRSAAALLRGTHDFGAFGRSPRAGGITVRTVDRVAAAHGRASSTATGRSALRHRGERRRLPVRHDARHRRCAGRRRPRTDERRRRRRACSPTRARAAHRHGGPGARAAPVERHLPGDAAAETSA